MGIEREARRVHGKFRSESIAKYLVSLVSCLVILILATGVLQAETKWPRIIPSQDGTPISYEVWGAGEPTLVFIHGWNCDSRYWRAQLPHFAKKHRVVALDLAGHGHSGVTRSQYTMASFGQDVKAVVEAIGSRRVILIGHSLGGGVMPEAARLIPERVIGMIGVDTLENIEFDLSAEGLDKMVAPFEKDFPAGVRDFVGKMFSPQTDQRLRDWIIADMSSAPPAVALSAMKEMLNQYVTGEAARIFEKLPIPLVTVGGDLWPINYEANRRHMFSYDAIVLKKADHFVMMDRPKEFNRALSKAIRMVSEKKGK